MQIFPRSKIHTRSRPHLPVRSSRRFIAAFSCISDWLTLLNLYIIKIGRVDWKLGSVNQDWQCILRTGSTILLSDDFPSYVLFARTQFVRVVQWIPTAIVYTEFYPETMTSINFWDCSSLFGSRWLFYSRCLIWDE